MHHIKDPWPGEDCRRSLTEKWKIEIDIKAMKRVRIDAGMGEGETNIISDHEKKDTTDGRRKNNNVNGATKD